MPDTIGEAFIAIRPDPTGFASDVDKAASGAATSAGKKIATLIGGAFAAAKVTDFLKDSFGEAQQSIKVAAQTDAVIKSTGKSAKVTSGQVNDLANSLSKKAGIDDEVIQSGANMLLTFTGIRNEVGKGNDVFNQATGASLDMAVAMKSSTGGVVDLKASSILLGKALNDPIKGVTALRRVGVQLTDQQEAEVKAHMAVGDILGAQKVILGEVTKEFGGSAAAQATDADKMNVAWGNLQESIGKMLIPVIRQLSDIMLPIFDYLSNHQGVLLAIAGIVGGALTVAFYSWAASLFAAEGALAILAGPVGLIVAALAALVIGTVLVWQHWDEIWTWIGNHPAYAIIIGLLGTLITGGILPLVFAGIWLAKNWDDVWSSIQSAVSTAWDFISGVFNEVVSHLTIIGYAAALIKGVWDGMFDGIKAAWKAVSGTVDTILSALGDIVDIAGKVKDALSDFGGGVLDTVDPAHLVHRASGGSVTSGSYIVGERGPELLRLGPGASGRVTNAADTANALSAGRHMIFNGPVSFGDRDVLNDLDYFLMVQNAGA